MSTSLSESAIRSYRETGFHFPVRVLTEGQAAERRRKLERAEAKLGGPLAGAYRHKCHLLFPWIADLVRAPAIVDAVASILGPDLLCWNTNLFAKEARHSGFVSWHQDSIYFGLSEPEGVTAWVALTRSAPESGCMRVDPGTHRSSEQPHVERPSAHNLLTLGQEVVAEVDESGVVDLVLEPGEMSLHDLLIVHGSNPNRSADRRIGVAIRYIPTSIRQLRGRDTATLVRGEDRHGNFDPEPRPEAELAEAALVAHARIVENHTRLILAGTSGEALR